MMIDNEKTLCLLLLPFFYLDSSSSFNIVAYLLRLDKN